MMIDIRPYYVAAENADELDAFTSAQGSEDVAVNWLGRLITAGCTAEAQIPAGYLEDPFVLGFAFSFCVAYDTDWPSGKKPADFAKDVFVRLFGPDSGAELHGRALNLFGDAHPDFVRGMMNAEKFHRGYAYPETCADEPLFGIAQQRAEEHLAKSGKHIPSGAIDEFVIDRYRRQACYDVYFMDVLRERYPNKVEWYQTALESMPASDEDDFEEDADVQPALTL